MTRWSRVASRHSRHRRRKHRCADCCSTSPVLSADRLRTAIRGRPLAMMGACPASTDPLDPSRARADSACRTDRGKRCQCTSRTAPARSAAWSVSGRPAPPVRAWRTSGCMPSSIAARSRRASPSPTDGQLSLHKRDRPGQPASSTKRRWLAWRASRMAGGPQAPASATRATARPVEHVAERAAGLRAPPISASSCSGTTAISPTRPGSATS